MRLIIQTGPNTQTTYIAHFTYKSELLHLYRGTFTTTRTYCTIHTGHCIRTSKPGPCLTAGIRVGIATVSPLDNFNRATGRKLAFTRAIAALPRPIRTALWSLYRGDKPATTNSTGGGQNGGSVPGNPAA